MARSRRERLHEATIGEIKATARRQMVEQGTAAVSLRAIAREMGVSAPALYRYFNGRDELITALILDAYHTLADTLEAVAQSHPAEDVVGRLRAGLLAYREWAVAHRGDYELILGNPIPGYSAPSEITQPAARRSLNLLVTQMCDAWRAGALTIPGEVEPLPAEIAGRLEGWRQYEGYEAPPALLALVVELWGTTNGLISMELFGHLQPILGDPGAFYRFEIDALLRRLGRST